ncbi:MAG TPA: hypothetical protein VFB89_05490, partial [Gemmatimonadales bacterium]|nr:hypothetical protein [Gemmatimonadales bacterium]
TLTSELIALFSLKEVGAPEFATQNAEGKKGGGWDMKLPGLPVYLQFKRAARMVRRTAQEAPAFKSLPFFRMYLHRRDHSDQHQLLLDLESQDNLVVYAAPGFSEADELNEAYSLDLVAARSIFVRPSAIGPLVDDERHWVAFQTTPPLARFCSEPHPIDFVLPDALFRRARAAAEPLRGRPQGSESYGAIAEELLATYERTRRTVVEHDRVAAIRRLRERRTAPDFVRLVARTLFQCELLILPL